MLARMKSASEAPIGQRLRSILDRALQINRASRWQSAAEFQLALEQ